MTKVRVLNEKGIEEFIKFIEEAKKNVESNKPDLNTNEFSMEFTPSIEIEENKAFDTRLEMAKYLYEKFENAGIKRNQIIGEENKGLWTWLAYIWFEQITNKRENIGRIERHVAFYPSSPREKQQRRNIHLIYGAYYLYSLLGEENSKIFLLSPPYKIWDTVDRLGCTEYVIRYPEIVKTAIHFYWDNEKNRPKPNLRDSDKPGNITRFLSLINQLELTYNIYQMKCEEIISLLPEEFNDWKT